VGLSDDIFEFEKIAKEASENQKDYFGLDKLIGRDDLIYITCIPWISFTHISHTISLNKNDSVPRISWGKYYKQGEKIWLPFSVQVNHSFIDGYHVGKYVERLQEFINEMK
jgi:chloramphenicol O-acetyltransferase type A